MIQLLWATPSKALTRYNTVYGVGISVREDRRLGGRATQKVTLYVIKEVTAKYTVLLKN